MTSLDQRLEEALNWPEEAKLKLLATMQRERWLSQARPEQLPPAGEWRTFYLMAGRGAGKSRACAEWLAYWEAQYEPGEWAIVAPTFGDARDTCAESAASGILPILGPRVLTWNRSLGEIHLKSGSRIFLDGADDGARRIQGRNLRGCWSEEIALWVRWEEAWDESIAFAVRHEPGRIIASGTPKMGHGLVRRLVEAAERKEGVVIQHMRTSDNVANLDPQAVAELYARYGGTRLGRQELEGEWISAIEGDVLKRAWWRYYEPQKRGESWDAFRNRLPKFQMILVSVDTPLKDKESSDFVAAQVWGVDKANRYLLDSRTERMGYEQAKRAISELSRWTRKNWPRAQHRVLIENAGYGVELIVDLKRELGLVEKISPGAEGNKGMRALSASADLETGNCYLPGRMKDDLSGPDERITAANILSLIDEAAMFTIDGTHGSHDDQVDAWSQCMNWLRNRQATPLRTSSVVRRLTRSLTS